MNRKIFYFIISLTATIFAQDFQVNKIEPPNWWNAMKKNKIQLMVYGKNLTDYSASFYEPNIKVEKIYKTANPDYSFIDISISSSAMPGNYTMVFQKDGEKILVKYPLFKIDKSKNVHQGFDDKDIVYLIMPDRFADGDTSNNIVKGMINDYKPGDPLGRHGGDLKGIADHLEYLKNLGVTSLWLTPVLENNTSISYHGYAATDLYKIDPRLGTNESYKELIAKAHSMGLKIIYDHVNNHISTNHPWMNDPPTTDWFNGTRENHLNAWHDKMVLWDPHGEKLTYDHLTKGWFVDNMADLNQNNEFVKNYLIENTIWWIEFAGIDGIREDTYPYIFPEFSAEWAKEILKEYPAFNIVGEVWAGEPAFLAPYQKNSKLNKKLNTNLPVVTDFALRDAYEKFLSGKSNFYEVFDVLSKDYLYDNPNNLLIFADNHDLPRVMFTANEDFDRVKLVLTHLFTSRGIPEILYGTEIGIVGNNEHGYIRTDFRGGFPNDSSNAFVESGRTKLENQIYDFVHKMIEIRKEYKPLFEGKLFHLAPINNVYIYTKSYKNELMLILLNGDKEKKEIDMGIIKNICGKNPTLYDVWNKKYADVENDKLLIEPMSANIFRVE